MTVSPHDAFSAPLARSEDCPENGWGVKFVHVLPFLGQKGKHTNKIPRKSQENALNFLGFGGSVGETAGRKSIVTSKS